MEIMLVIGMLAVIALIIIVAINPSTQLSATRDGKRNMEKRELENAISQYIIDGNSLTGTGAVNTGIANAEQICQDAVSWPDCNAASGYEIYSLLIPNYLVGLPVDPDETGSTLTGYYIYKQGAFYKICNPNIDTGCAGL